MRELCETHKLVLAPDGKCVVCRRPAQPVFQLREEHETLISRLVTVALGLGLVAGVVSLVYVWRLDPGYTGARITARGFDTPGGPAQQDAPAEAMQAAETAQSEATATPAPNAKDSATAKGASEQTERTKAKAEVKATARVPAESLSRVEVVMYATPWCDICDRARALLLARGVTLIERDIDADKQAAQQLAKINSALPVPTFQVDGRTLVGFNPWDLEDALRDAAEQRLAHAR